jgi:hypothetical protein
MHVVIPALPPAPSRREWNWTMKFSRLKETRPNVPSCSTPERVKMLVDQRLWCRLPLEWR